MKPFSLYMYEWLYAKNGYYASMPDIGKSGDFYTSVSTSIFFGGSIANYLIKVIDEGFLPKKTTIIEIGAHKGYLLADIIQFIFTLRPKLLESLEFVVIEPLEKIQIAQKEYFKQAFGGKVEVEVVSSIDLLTCKSAFVVSNELFDAFCCEVIHEDTMLYIDKHKPVFKPMTKQIKQLAQKYDIQKGEIALGYDDFASSLDRNIEKFECVSFDYGDKMPRNDISLRVYKNHEVFAFFELTKMAGKDEQLEQFFAKSDITYDVCFDMLIEAFEEKNIKLHGLKTQMVALNDFGIIELLEILQEKVSQKAYAKEVEKVKQLILPSFLGERFKMISFRKG